MKKTLLFCLFFNFVLLMVSANAGGRLFDGNNFGYANSDLYDMTMADFNGDGDLDVVAALESNDIAIFLVNDEGTLSRSYIFDLQQGDESINLYTLETIDIDNDGDRDIIAVIESDDSYLRVFLNNSDTTITYYADYETYNTSGGLAVFDIDDDGDEDVVHTSTTYLGVFANNGDGTLAARVDYPCGPNWTYTPGVADFDGDGDYDLACPNYGYDTLRVMFNDGAGAFDSVVGYPTGNNPSHVAVADLNGDGHADVAIGGYGGSGDEITLHFNNGDGTFADSVLISLPSRAICIAAADIDEDGDNDLIASQWSESDSAVVVMRNDGSGAFAAPELYMGAYPQAIKAHDFDKDGHLDLAIGGGHGCVDIKYNDGGGDFSGPEKITTSNRSIAVECADLNGDGYPDIAVGNNLSRNVSVFMNNQDSTFAAPVGWSMGTGLNDLILADIDNQNGLDMITADYDADSVSVQINNGNGMFTGAPYTYAVGNAPNRVVAADIDGDTYLDLVTVNKESDDLSILYNNGDGTFADAVSLPVGVEPVELIAFDVDDDGDQDLVYNFHGTYTVDGGIVILVNDGAGNFSEGADINAREYVSTLAAYDVTGDGYKDILTAYSGILYMNASNGDGTFADSACYYTGTEPYEIIAGDYDLDGDLDLAMANGYSGFNSVMYNYGNGTFMNPINYLINDYNFEIAQGDLDQDGDLDLISITTTSEIDAMMIFWNMKEQVPVDVDGDGSFAGPIPFELSQNYPNPFNPVTAIDYSLASQGRVTIEVFNILGQQVRTLIDQTQAAGNYTIYWDGCDNDSRAVASGIYFYRITAGDFVQTRKMMLLK